MTKRVPPDFNYYIIEPDFDMVRGPYHSPESALIRGEKELEFINDNGSEYEYFLVKVVGQIMINKKLSLDDSQIS